MLKTLRLLLLALLVVAFSAFCVSRLKSYAPPALAVVGQLNVGAQTDLINYVRSKTIYESDLYFGADQNAGVLTSTGYVMIGQPVARGTAVAPAGFLLDANGRMRGTGVNIGTTATAYKLEVLDSAVSHGNAARFQGNVGIGYGVTANDVPLNVYQTAVGAPAVKINDSNNKPAGIGVNNGVMLFTTNNGATDNTQMTIKNDGNVGVGTTDALAKLYVSNGSNPGDIMSLRGGTSGYNMIFGLDDSQAYIYNNSSSRKLTFGTNSQKSGLVLDTNGNVGVGGATSPGAKLDVGGSVSMISNNSGNINIVPSGNTIFTQGNIGVGTASPGNRIEAMRTLANDGSSFIGNINSKLYGTTTGTSNTALRGDNQLGQTIFSGGINSGVWGTSAPNGQTVSSVNIGVIGTGGYIGYGLPAATLAGTGIGVLAAGSNFDLYAPSGNPSYFAGYVGIGTSAPDASLDLGGGAISSNANGQRTYQNLYQYADSNNPDTGTLAIAMPQGWTNTMMRIRIVGYEYGAAGSWEVIVGGYNYAPSTSWVNYTAEIRGTAPFTQVRLGYNGSKMVILLGNTTTTWHYPKFTVAEFIAGHSNISGWGSGWSSSFLTSEASIANIVTPAINMYMTTGGNLGIGGPTVVSHRLESNGTAVIGALAAKVFQMGSWLCPNGGMEMGSSGEGAYCFVGGLSVDSGGDVGIGIPTASYPLHLYKASSETGILTSWGSSNIYLSHGGWGIGEGKFGIGNGSNPTMVVDGVNSYLGVGTSSPKSKFSVSFNNGDMFNVYQPSDNRLAIQTSIDNQALNGGYAYADSNYILQIQPYVGTVAIGQTGLFPTAKLEVSQVNPSGWSGNLKGFRIVSPDTNYWLSIDTSVCSGVCWTYSTNAGSNSMTINNNGYIGMGMVAASNRLVVGDDSLGASLNPSNTLSVGNTGGDATIQAGSSTGKGYFKWIQNDGGGLSYLSIGSGGNYMKISPPAGGLGINMIPASKFQVYGDGTFANGSFAVGGHNIAWAMYNQGSQRLCHTGGDGTGAQWVVPVDCVGSPGDFAEYYGTIPKDAQPGDLIALDEGGNIKVRKSAGPNDKNIVGIISTYPNDVIGKTIAESDNPYPVALIGRVPLKVSLENGPIKVGDYLTSSSQPGVAMKATKPGTVIGQAIEDYDGSFVLSPETKKTEDTMVRETAQPAMPDTAIRAKPGNPRPPLPQKGVGKIVVNIRLGWYDPDVYLTSTGDLKIKEANGKYEVRNEKTNDLITRIGTFAELVVARIQAGIIETKRLIVNNVDILQKITDMEKRINEMQQKLDSQNARIIELQQKLNNLSQK